MKQIVSIFLVTSVMVAPLSAMNFLRRQGNGASEQKEPEKTFRSQVKARVISNLANAAGDAITDKAKSLLPTSKKDNPIVSCEVGPNVAPQQQYWTEHGKREHVRKTTPQDLKIQFLRLALKIELVESSSNATEGFRELNLAFQSLINFLEPLLISADRRQHLEVINQAKQAKNVVEIARAIKALQDVLVVHMGWVAYDHDDYELEPRPAHSENTISETVTVTGLLVAISRLKSANEVLVEDVVTVANYAFRLIKTLNKPELQESLELLKQVLETNKAIFFEKKLV